MARRDILLPIRKPAESFSAAVGSRKPLLSSFSAEVIDDTSAKAAA